MLPGDAERSQVCGDLADPGRVRAPSGLRFEGLGGHRVGRRQRVRPLQAQGAQGAHHAMQVRFKVTQCRKEVVPSHQAEKSEARKVQKWGDHI